MSFDFKKGYLRSRFGALRGGSERSPVDVIIDEVAEMKTLETLTKLRAGLILEGESVSGEGERAKIDAAIDDLTGMVSNLLVDMREKGIEVEFNPSE